MVKTQHPVINTRVSRNPNRKVYYSLPEEKNIDVDILNRNRNIINYVNPYKY